MTENTNSNLRFAVLATDVLLFTVRNGELLVRLIEVNRPPHFVNKSGLPGGLIKPTETAWEAAERCLGDKGKITTDRVYLEQLFTFDAVDRDPRGRVVSVAYLGCVAWEYLSDQEKDSGQDSSWQSVKLCRGLAYDHDEIVAVGLQRLKSKIKYTTLLSKLLPEEFTLTELKDLYEIILDEKIDKRNFRKKINQLGVLSPLGKKNHGKKSRPAELYSFVDHVVVDLNDSGVKSVV